MDKKGITPQTIRYSGIFHLTNSRIFAKHTQLGSLPDCKGARRGVRVPIIFFLTFTYPDQRQRGNENK